MKTLLDFQATTIVTMVAIYLVILSGCSSSDEKEENPSRDVSALTLDSTNDANSDGIRDDVNSFIDDSYSRTSTERDAAMMFARDINTYSVSISSDEANRTSIELQKTIECIYLYLSDVNEDQTAAEMISDLEGETFNSKERAKAFYGTDELLTQSIYTAINPSRSECF